MTGIQVIAISQERTVHGTQIYRNISPLQLHLKESIWPDVDQSEIVNLRNVVAREGFRRGDPYGGIIELLNGQLLQSNSRPDRTHDRMHEAADGP